MLLVSQLMCQCFFTRWNQFLLMQPGGFTRLPGPPVVWKTDSSKFSLCHSGRRQHQSFPGDSRAPGAWNACFPFCRSFAARWFSLTFGRRNFGFLQWNDPQQLMVFPCFFVGNLVETPSFRGRWSHDENTCACLVWLVELQVTKEWTGPRQVCSNAGSKKKHFKAVEHVLWEFFTTPHCNFECSNVLERVLFEKAWIFLPETHVSWPLNLALRLLWWVAHWCILDTAINVASAAEKASRMSFTSKML